MRKYLATIVLLLPLAACTPTQVANLLNVSHPAQNVVTITEDQVDVPNVSPPQRLDEVMNPSGDPVQRCLDFGGEPIWYPTFKQLVCEGIDY